MPLSDAEIKQITNTAKPLESWQKTANESGLEVTAFNFEENLEDPKVANLLRAIHSGIYNTTFPIPEEQEDVEDWVQRGQEAGAIQNSLLQRILLILLGL